ncbi:MAG: protein kinase, partial [Elusimicrobia bacterium]|nr:protein kinase [Elusimicrobiota bacterium]
AADAEAASRAAAQAVAAETDTTKLPGLQAEADRKASAAAAAQIASAAAAAKAAEAEAASREAQAAAQEAAAEAAKDAAAAAAAQKAAEAAAQRAAAAQQARKDYEARIGEACSGVEQGIATAEGQRDIVVETARGIKEVPDGVKGAWDTMETVYEDLDTANGAVNAAKAYRNPESNIHNAQYLVQDSRKGMYGVASMLQMDVPKLFGFVPPPNWNGAMPGERPVNALDPRGVTPSNNPNRSSWFNIGFPGLSGGGTGAQGGAQTGGPGVKNTGAQAGGGAAGGGGPAEQAIPLLRSSKGGITHEGLPLASDPAKPASPSAREPGQAGYGASAWGRNPYARERGVRGEAEQKEGPLGGAGRGPAAAGPWAQDSPVSEQTAESWKLSLEGKYYAAEKSAREAIRLHPAEYQAYEALAWAELGQGRYREAEGSASRAISLNSRSARAYRIRAFARQMLGDRAGMISDIEMAARLNPDYADEAELARRGGNIYDPSKGDAEFLNPRRSRKSPLKPILWGLLLLAASAAGAAVLWARRRKESSPGVGAAPVAESPASSLPDALAKGYALGQQLGDRRGSVFLAKDIALGRTAVIRRLNVPDTKERESVLAAARKAARFSHPAAARIYEVVEAEESAVIVSEHVAGATVRSLIDTPRGAGLDMIVRILAPVCQALEAAHAAGIAHGRLHLGNIFLSEGGEVKVADFGTALGGGPAQDIQALGRCLAGLLASLKSAAPPKLQSLVSRSQGSEPAVKSAGEFLRLLKE